MSQLAEPYARDATILNIFNRHVELGGEAHAVKAIVDSLGNDCTVESCYFDSRDWIGNNAPPFWSQAMWMVRNPRSVEIVRQTHERVRPDVWLLHNVFPVGSAALYRLAQELEVPVIQYIHNFRPFSVNGYLWANHQILSAGLQKNFWPEIQHASWRNSRLKTAWFAAVLLFMHSAGWWRSVNAWVAISEFMRSKFIEAGVPAEKIHTLRHFWNPTPRIASRGVGKRYLFLGRLTEEKGVMTLLDAWENLEREFGAEAPELLIAGEGPLAAAVAARAEKLKRVHVAGFLTQELKTAALNEARALIVPSVWWEPLGLVIYEAYNASVPVLAAKSGGLQEIVVDGQTGMLHTPGDPKQLAEQIMHMDRNLELAAQMGQNGRDWLEANADEAEWRRSFLKIVEAVRDRTSRSSGPIPAV